MRTIRSIRNVAFLLMVIIALWASPRVAADGGGSGDCDEPEVMCCVYIWGTSQQICESWFIEDACEEVFGDSGDRCDGWIYYNPDFATPGDCYQEEDGLWYSVDEFGCWWRRVEG